MIRRWISLVCHALGAGMLLLSLAHTGRGEETGPMLIGESRAAALRLAEVRKRLDKREWVEAIDELQAILHATGNDLVSLTPTHSVQARRLCQIQLAELPPEALRLYRQRYETPARKKLEQAQADRDVAPLRQIVEEAFCTKAAEKALDLLGDRAFERGRFAEAEEWWSLLAPLPDPRRDVRLRGLTLSYPDPAVDPARVQAKQLLARLFQGTPGDWPATLDAYRKRHGKAEGILAGRTGRYADLLQTLAQERARDGAAEPADWHTFAGDSQRGRVAAASEDFIDRLCALCRDGPTWSLPLEDGAAESSMPSPALSATQARSLAFYPAIVGNQVLVADARRVTAYDVRTGEKNVWYDAALLNGGLKPNLKLPAAPDLRYSLTVADDKVFARLGAQDIGGEATGQVPAPRFGQPARAGRDNETLLACLSLRPDGEGGHFRWLIRGVVGDNASFEGAPLVADGQIWIASTRRQDSRRIASIDCYPVEESSPSPLRWRRDLCKVREEKVGETRFRHHLLTRAGTRVFYCTHSGVVAAVDAWSGQTHWANRYPRWVPERDMIDLRDLAPPLFAAGRLFVAPADADRLMCLDPSTGRTLWERESLRVVHLLGVSKDKLFFTTLEGLHAIRLDDGNRVWDVPWTGKLTPGGRGLLVGDVVLFPTTQKHNNVSPSLDAVVYAIRQEDGRPAELPSALHRLPSGNLAYSNGILVVADRQTLSIFAPPRLRLPARKAAAERDPDSVAAWLDLARTEVDAGDAEAALRSLHTAEEVAQKLSPARRHRYETAVFRERKRMGERGHVSTPSEHPTRGANVKPLDGNTHGASTTPLAGNVRGADELPLARAWHFQLDGDEWLLDGPQTCDPRLLLIGSRAGGCTCRDAVGGVILWRQRLSFEPHWADGQSDVVVIAGERDVVGVRRADGEKLWHFSAPAGRGVLEPKNPQPLSAFRLAAGRLFFLQGQRRFFALRADNGEILWDRWAPDGALMLPFPWGCYAPRYHAGEETVLLQSSSRRWLLDAGTGRLRHEAKDSRELWQRPPLPLDARTVAVAVDNQQVELLDVRTGKSLWTHELTGGISGSGEPLALLGRGDVLLRVKPTNVGFLVQRLDRATGKPVWTRPRLLTAKRVDPDAWDFDSQALYTCEEGTLTACALADGRVLWRRPFADAEAGRVRCLGECLAVWPRDGEPDARLRLRTPIGSVQWSVGPLRMPESAFLLSLHDAKTGQRIQRFSLRIETPARTTWERFGSSMQLRTTSWSASATGSVLRLDSPWPVIAVGGEVWGLTQNGEQSASVDK